MIVLILLRQQVLHMGGQRAAHDLLGGIDYPLHCLPVLSYGACVPYAQTVRQYTFHRAATSCPYVFF